VLCMRVRICMYVCMYIRMPTEYALSQPVNLGGMCVNICAEGLCNRSWVYVPMYTYACMYVCVYVCMYIHNIQIMVMFFIVELDLGVFDSRAGFGVFLQ
jgi:hypothetical protein